VQELRKVGTTITCIACLVVGCGRRSPTSPTATGALSPSVQTISIRSNTGGTSLTHGQSVQLKAIARLSDDSEYDITPLATWLADDERVATVTPMGLVTAQAPGSGHLRATYQQATGVTTFEVSDAPASSSGPSVPSSPDSGPAPSASGGTPPTPPPGSPSPTPGPGVPPALPPTVHSLTITGGHAGRVGRSAQPSQPVQVTPW